MFKTIANKIDALPDTPRRSIKATVAAAVFIGAPVAGYQMLKADEMAQGNSEATLWLQRAGQKVGDAIDYIIE